MHTVDDPGRVASGILALLVHLLFFGLLVSGLSWQKKIVGPVMVDLWEELPEPVTKVSAPPPKTVETPPKPAPEVKKEPPPPPPKVEAPPKPSPAEIELREKVRKQKEEDEARRLEEKKAIEAEKRRLEEERRAADEQRRSEEEAKRLEQEELKREEERKLAEEAKRLEEKKAIEAEKRRLEEERKLAEEAKRLDQVRLKREADERERAAAEAKRSAEAAARAVKQKTIEDWIAKIRVAIRGRVVVPPTMQGNPVARFEVVLLPTGEVLNATLRKSSGVPAYDAAVERAIMAAQPLPVPKETELFQENFRELILEFRPKD